MQQKQPQLASQYFRRYLALPLGNLLLAFGVGVFLIPFHLILGGISGIAQILAPYLPAIITVDLAVAALSLVLFLFGLITLGRTFALRTLLSSILYPLALSFFARVVESGTFDLRSNTAGDPTLTAALFGGVFVGIGCGLCFLGGGSTGGLDILAFYLCKKHPTWKKSRIIFFFDAGIILLGFLLRGNFHQTLLGILAAFISTSVMDRMIPGSYGAYAAQIISRHHEEINRRIIRELGRTTSILEVVGGFSGEKSKLLIVFFRMSEYARLNEIIHTSDPEAFVSIQKAHEVNGNGWK